MKVYRNKTRERVNSGIYGYDELLGGGYFKQTVNVIMGGAGTGKTIFGSQFLYQGAQSGKKGLYITTSEHVESLKKDMYSSFNWDFWELENSGMISFRDAADPGMRAHKKIDKEPTKLIETFKKYLSHTIEEVQPDRVFIDSMETMFLVIKSHYTLMMCVDDLFDVLILLCQISRHQTSESEQQFQNKRNIICKKYSLHGNSLLS